MGFSVWFLDEAYFINGTWSIGAITQKNPQPCDCGFAGGLGGSVRSSFPEGAARQFAAAVRTVVPWEGVDYFDRESRDTFAEDSFKHRRIHTVDLGHRVGSHQYVYPPLGAEYPLPTLAIDYIGRAGGIKA